MKSILKGTLKVLIASILFMPIRIHAQVKTDREKMQYVLDSLHITLNNPPEANGYKRFYNCDSMPFFKRVSGDSISILTPGIETPVTYESEYEFNSFQYYLSHRNSFPPVFPKRFEHDNRLLIVEYKETLLLFRNDSLFEVEMMDDDFTKKSMDLIDQYVNGKIDSLKMEKRIAKARNKYKIQPIEKFIFNSKFQEKTKIPIAKSLNRRNATITVESKTLVNDRYRYVILIEENYDGIKTAVRYRFDNRMFFYDGEGCNP